MSTSRTQIELVSIDKEKGLVVLNVNGKKLDVTYIQPEILHLEQKTLTSLVRD